MRSSSVKTLVVTVSMFAVVSATAVTAEARPARQARTTVSAPRADEGAVARAIATMKALQQRIFGVINYSMVSPPWPSPTSSTSTVSDPLTVSKNK